MAGSCGKCRYWSRINNNEQARNYHHGRCRRYAPRPQVLVLGRAFDDSVPEEWPLWPITLDEEWCGEYSY